MVVREEGRVYSRKGGRKEGKEERNSILIFHSLTTRSLISQAFWWLHLSDAD